MRTLPQLGGVLALFICVLILCGCANHTVDPSGTWEWSEQLDLGKLGTRTFKYALSLKLVGGRLTGTLAANGDEGFPIENAKITGEEIAFDTGARKFGTQSFTGRLSVNTIRGHVTTTFDDGHKPKTKEWIATRKKP